MKTMIRLTLTGLVVASLGAYEPAAHAQRGGGGRPSAGLRGGGTFVPRSSPSPSFNRSPSFTAPQQPRFAPGAGFQVQPQAGFAAPAHQPAVAAPRPAAPAATAPIRTTRPGSDNHQAWVRGYWHGRHNNNGFWNNGAAFATGAATGWGLASATHAWGYRPFVNPFVVAPEQPSPVVSQPLQATDAPPADPADQAMLAFDAARASFKAGLHDAALQKTDLVLQSMPNDAAIREFRALCLFALQRYDEAAETLYSVLSAGPGWDWATLVGLYPNVDVYAAQLNALERYRAANPDSAAAHFVLGYHYLTEGFDQSAAREFNRVLELKPNDPLSRMLVANLTGATPAQPAAADPAAATAADPAGLVGTWKASADADTAIVLTLGADGSFTWNVARAAGSQAIAGTYSLADGVLSLVRGDVQNDSMVGRVTRKDASRFVFQALGGGPDDPGLEFSK